MKGHLLLILSCGHKRQSSTKYDVAAEIAHKQSWGWVGSQAFCDTCYGLQEVKDIQAPTDPQLVKDSLDF